jgi:type VI secretion system secreted protein Hcp
MPVFIKFDGIDGDSHAHGHERWIEVESFSWGATHPAGSGAGGGGGAGRVSMQDFHFTCPAGKGSPALFLKCCNGQHIPAVQIDVTRSSEGHDDPVQAIKLEDCLITSFQAAGDGGSIPMESISINFAKIEYRQYIQLPNGAFESERAFWDVRTNTGG